MVPEFDLHSMTKDEALVETDRQLNHYFIQDIEDRRLRFITGWGGVLRPVVQAFLEDHPLVKETQADGPTLKILLEDL